MSVCIINGRREGERQDPLMLLVITIKYDILRVR